MPKTHSVLFAVAVCLLVAVSASAQDSRLYVRGYAGAAFSKADNGGESEETSAFGGGVGLHLSRHFAVIGDVAYMPTLTSEEGVEAINLVTALITFVEGADVEVRLKARTLFALGGGRFTFGDPGGGFVPFVEGQGGIARSTFKLEIASSNPTLVLDATRIFEDVIGKSSSTAPVIAAAAGADFRLSRHFAAEGAYRYLRLFGDAKTNIHQVFGGVVVRF